MSEDCPGHGSTAELTDSQRALLESAAREGYFEVPRRVTTGKLAETHGVSDREASRELRRAVDAVLCDVDIGEL